MPGYMIGNFVVENKRNRREAESKRNRREKRKIRETDKRTRK